jgi:hypothetical protein
MYVMRAAPDQHRELHCVCVPASLACLQFKRVGHSTRGHSSRQAARDAR